MKQLTKALLLAIGFLPLVSFADGDCSKIDLNTISKDYKILKCANNDLYTYADPNDKTNTQLVLSVLSTTCFQPLKNRVD